MSPCIDSRSPRWDWPPWPEVFKAGVEDSRFGVEAARAAGMHAFGFTGSVTGAAALEGPNTTVFGDMLELPGLLL